MRVCLDSERTTERSGGTRTDASFEKHEAYDDDVYRPENLAILKYCYDNYEYNSYIDALIEKVSAVQEETNTLQESMEEEIDGTVSSLDEKDEEESKEQKVEERIDHPFPPSNESNSSTHTKDDCYDDCYNPVDSLEIPLFNDACYAWNLCEIYDFTCFSENPKKHLPYQCEFGDNGIVSSYANGV